jgi:hypothetical protein
MIISMNVRFATVASIMVAVVLSLVSCSVVGLVNVVSPHLTGMSFRAYSCTPTCLFSSPRSSSTEKNKEETEVEKLLRKARELRAQASMEEQAVHQQLSEKRMQKDQHYDDLIELYLTSPNKNNIQKNGITVVGVQYVVDRLHQKPISMETLEHLLDRLDDKHAMASGKEHVIGVTDFQRTQKPKNEAEMKFLDDQIELLLQAVEVLDQEFRDSRISASSSSSSSSNQKNQKMMGGVAGDASGSWLYSVSAAEASHWGGGQAATHLRQRWQEKRRERHEQFLKRQKEFYDAQRVKKDRPAPPKVGDDHGFIR